MQRPEFIERPTILVAVPPTQPPQIIKPQATEAV
jgi:hypothetical protein